MGVALLGPPMQLPEDAPSPTVKQSWWDETVNFYEGGDGELNLTDVLGWGAVKSTYHYASGGDNVPVIGPDGQPQAAEVEGIAAQAATKITDAAKKTLGYGGEITSNIATAAIAAAVIVGSIAVLYIVFEIKQVVRAA